MIVEKRKGICDIKMTDRSPVPQNVISTWEQVCMPTCNYPHGLLRINSSTWKRSYIPLHYSGERWSRGRAPDSIEGTVVQSHLPPFRNLGNFYTPHLPVSFGSDTKSRWSLLSGVYARGSKRSHTGGKCVTCSGLTNSREEQLLR